MEHTKKVIENGIIIETPKISYNTDKEAISIARKMNIKGNRIHKVVSYKCSICNKWHIGKNKTILTNKEIERFKKLDLFES